MSDTNKDNKTSLLSEIILEGLKKMRLGLGMYGLYSEAYCKEWLNTYFIPELTKPERATKISIGELKEEMDKLTSDQRSDLMHNYCVHCGDKDPRCQCWNDD